jgi:hypothetical protein
MKVKVKIWHAYACRAPGGKTKTTSPKGKGKRRSATQEEQTLETVHVLPRN